MELCGQRNVVAHSSCSSEVAGVRVPDQTATGNIPSPSFWNKRMGRGIYQGMRAHIVGAALLLSAAVSLNANDPMSMAVSPAQSFAPTNLTIRVHMKPDADNRALEVVAESGANYRSSRTQLDGAEAPRTMHAIVESALARRNGVPLRISA